MTSELTRVEFASAVHAARRANRLVDARAPLDRFDATCGDDGPISLLRLDTEHTFPLARSLLADHPLRTLDAIHLAVALTDAAALAGEEPIAVVTRDQRQADAVAALGREVR